MHGGSDGNALTYHADRDFQLNGWFGEKSGETLVTYASFWERRDQNGVSFPEEEGPDPSGVRPWAFAHDEGIVT